MRITIEVSHEQTPIMERTEALSLIVKSIDTEARSLCLTGVSLQTITDIIQNSYLFEMPEIPPTAFDIEWSQRDCIFAITTNY